MIAGRGLHCYLDRESCDFVARPARQRCGERGDAPERRSRAISIGQSLVAAGRLVTSTRLGELPQMGHD
jgi:hypothetical protein